MPLGRLQCSGSHAARGPTHPAVPQPQRSSAAAPRKSNVVTHAVAEPQPRVSWDEVKELSGHEALHGFHLNAGAAPATSPTLPLPPSPNPASTKPVVMFRDTNAWCPYCQKVWMALLEKGIPFDTVLISLADKPAWFAQVNEAMLTPVARVNGVNIAESDDILMAFEREFPDSPSLMGSDDGGAVTEFLASFKAVAPAIFRAAVVGGGDAVARQEAVDTVRGFLGTLEAEIEEHGGPHLCGAFSLADVTVAPFMPELVYTEQPEIRLNEFPRVRGAVEALMARDSFKRTAVDRHTARTIRQGLFGVKTPVTLDVTDEVMVARKEAAAKITANRSVIAKRLVSHSGVVRQQGSPYCETEENVNGYSMNTREAAFVQQAEAALLRVCTTLLTGDAGPSPASKEAVALQVACLAYFRNLGSAPRDMSAAAMVELRAACDHVVQAAYEFPEKDLRPKR